MGIHEGGWFAAHIVTGNSKQLLELQLTLMPAATCLGNTFVAVMAAEKYFAVTLHFVG